MQPEFKSTAKSVGGAGDSPALSVVMFARRKTTMDLKVYYQKIKDLERSFKFAHPVVVSQETPDGGTAGVMTEVSPHIAATMIVDGRAVLATEKEAREFLEQKTEAK